MYHALIRTHHITSRKKIARLKDAAKVNRCFALLKSGGVPGVMYVCGGSRVDVQTWVDVVHDLRYKDYQLAAPVNAIESRNQVGSTSADDKSLGVLEEVTAVKEMAAYMQLRGLMKWWRVGMGFTRE